MDDSYRLMAARCVRKHAKQLGEQFAGIRKAEDIECVHRARVASRRLRAALRVFRDCFPRKWWRAWRKEIRRITRELGEARDKDVQLEFVLGALHTVREPAQYPGVVHLCARIDADRRALQPAVLAALNRLERSGVLCMIQDRAKRILAKGKKKDSPSRSEYARRRAGKHVARRLAAMTALEDSLADEADVERHHAMRIAAKRLRYTMETVAPVYEGRLDEAIQAAKRVQTLLGEIHDCDVWIERLDAFAESERLDILDHFGTECPLARLSPGIEYLRQDRRRHRRLMFEELVAYWQELAGAGVWRRLEWIIHEAPPPQKPGTTPVPEAAGEPRSAPPGDSGAAAQAVPSAVATSAPSAEAPRASEPFQPAARDDGNGKPSTRAAEPVS